MEKLSAGVYKTAAIIGHSSVDPDAIASAFGMKFLLENLYSNIAVDILVDGVSKHTNPLIDHFQIKFSDKAKEKYDLLIIVDVNNPTQFGSFKELIFAHPKEAIVIIDHHSPTSFSKDHADIAYIHEQATSVAEMVTEILFDLDVQPPADLLTILLVGILYDSRRFYQFSVDLARIMVKLLEKGADYSLAINLLQQQMDKSERMARLKGASRIEIQKMNNWLIVWSRVSSHEGTTARGILDLGADVAFITSQRKNETRLNVRAKRRFYQATKIHFGNDVMSVLGEKYDGDGGGHSTAAALNIPKIIPSKELKKKTLNIIRKLLKKNTTEKKD
jgi:nanoRNase/pAp phosphatase (c-di-AMP/oligoRNAs hydrolase)